MTYFCFSFVRQTKHYNVALFIYQALQCLSSIKPSAAQGQRTQQQAQALMEKLETTVRKVLECFRTTVGVGRPQNLISLVSKGE